MPKEIPKISDELKEISELLNELNLFSRGIDELEKLLYSLFGFVKEVMVCANCHAKLSDLSCGNCGSSCETDDVYCGMCAEKIEKGQHSIFCKGSEPIKTIEFNGNDKTPYFSKTNEFKAADFSEEEKRLFFTLLKNHRTTILLFKSLKTINIIKDLQIAPNNSIEKTYVEIYLLLNAVDTKFFDKDIKSVETGLDVLSKLLEEEKIDLNAAGKLKKSGESLGTIEGTLSLLCFNAGKLLKLIKEVEVKLNKIKESPILNEIYKVCKGRVQFSINPAHINSKFTGKINVVIRHVGDETDTESLKNIFNSFLKGVEDLGSVANYNMNINSLMMGAIEDIIKKNENLFYDVYGGKLNIQIFLDIQYLKGSAGFVGETIKRIFHGKEVSIRKYDESLRTLEINIQASYLYDCIVGNRVDDFSDTLIHEIGHLFDKKIKSGCSIKQEGIAVFTEFAYGGHSPQFSIGLIKSLMNNPIKDYEGYIEVKTKWTKPGEEISPVPYWLGEYMCFVIYLALLKRKYPSFNRDVLNRDNLIKLTYLADTALQLKEMKEYAQNVLKIVRNMDNKKFFYFYTKYSKELGLDLIFSDYEKLLDEILTWYNF